jgi:citrate synthase
MESSQASALLKKASDWWSTSIIDIQPGVIRPRGIPIQDLIGTVSFPQMIWLMLRGTLPNVEQAKLFESALVAAVDHGPQAPSIAIARMAVSCGLPLNSAMASAVNVLDDVHGGAGEQCLAIYRDVLKQTTEHDVSSAVSAVLDDYVRSHGKIIPGFGHRFHSVDPRAVRLLQLVEEARRQGTVTGDHSRVATEIEATLQRRTGKVVPMNIDGATAVIYGELGFEPALARGLFVLSRSVGILAHAWEQSNQVHRIKGPMPTEIPYTYTGPRNEWASTEMERSS